MARERQLGFQIATLLQNRPNKADQSYGCDESKPTCRIQQIGPSVNEIAPEIRLASKN